MLFGNVNEEPEECLPIFSKPKKVHPETEDEMVRRIKYTLGEYVHENEVDLIDSKNHMMNESTLPTDIVSLSNEIEKYQNKTNADENIKTEILGESTKTCENTSMEQTKEKLNTINDDCENTSTTSTSRRYSLKRQCKERISLLDYNPMLTIRAKRTKGSVSSRTKSVDSIEELTTSALGCTEKFPDDLMSQDLSSVECSESEKDEIPNLKPFPTVQVSDSFSELYVKNSPPLLDVSSPSCSFPSFNTKNLTAMPNINDESCNPETVVKVKGKKQTKKRSKKNICKSVSSDGELPNDSFLSAKNPQENTSDSKIGSCLMKNGILKIRFSKLTGSKKIDSETDYEVSHNEAAAFGCKRLSVPLEPLAPSLYSAYCVLSKNKNKEYSPKCKRPGKKKEKKNLEKKEEKCENHERKSEGSVCTKQGNVEQIIEDTKNMSEMVASLEIEKETEKDENTVKESKKNSDINDQYTNTHSIVINNTSPKISYSENLIEEEESKILCSIDLSKITRIPIKNVKPQISANVISECIKEVLDQQDNLDMPFSISPNQYTSVSSGEKIRSTCIKKEICTPPSFELMKNDHASSENNLFPLTEHEENRHETCPKLTPAYPLEEETTEGILDCADFDNDSPNFSKLCAEETDYISDFQHNESSKTNVPIFHGSQDTKVKVELLDSTLSNPEKWNDYNEYKWSHDHTDITYRNGTTMFKEQVTYNITNHRFWQDPELKKQYSSEYYLNEAKKLKHQADKEIDRMVQAMKYLEAVLYFILTGNAMEHSYIDTDRVHTMYKETLTLIRFISSKFQKLHNSSCRNIDNKLTVLSLRCQSLLYLKMYQLRRDEVRYLHRCISSFLKSDSNSLPENMSPPHLQSFKPNVKHPQVSPSYQASPCSLTPSPAGSVASVSSQSSGYSSSELGWSTTFSSNNIKAKFQNDLFSDNITVSRNKYKMLQQQSMYLANLHLSHDLWEHADYLSSKEHSREFFMELDEECGCLTLHSPFSALVHYVRKGLYKLKDGT